MKLESVAIRIQPMDFTIIGEIDDVETIATGRQIRELRRLKRAYGAGPWLK